MDAKHNVIDPRDSGIEVEETDNGEGETIEIDEDFRDLVKPLPPPVPVSNPD